MGRTTAVVTLATIARRCRVSVATVSKALSDEPSRCDLPTLTRDRIRQAAERLGYTAGWRRSRLRPTIALVLPGHHFYLSGAYFDLIPELIRACDQHDAILVTLAVADPKDLEVELTRRQVRGAIILQADASWMTGARASRYPLVLYNNDLGPECVRVMPDERAHVEMALAHLVHLGHRNFCYVDSMGNDHCSAELRLQSALSADGQAGKSVVLARHREALIAAIRNGATAVIAYSGVCALTAWGWATEAGYRVPHDFSLVALSHADLLTHTSPAITMIWHPVDRMAMAAVSALLVTPDQPRGGIFLGRIGAGGSTGIPRTQ